MLDLGLVARRDSVGAELEYAHRLGRAWSAYAHGWIGFALDERWRASGAPVLDYTGVVGLRARW